ncbi:hypothetical protein GCM10027051_15440 [Niabella terrae]
MKKTKPIYDFLPALIVGAIEGTILTLAVYSFLLAKGMRSDAIWWTCAIIAFFAALLLGLGGYFTRKAENAPGGASANLQRIYQSLDIEEGLRQAMIQDTVTENQQWEAQWKQGDNATGQLQPLHYGLSIFTGFIVCALVIILNNYLLGLPDFQALLLPLVLLGFLGYQKYRSARKNPMSGLLIIGLAGMAAAVGAYFAGGFFM